MRNFQQETRQRVDELSTMNLISQAVTATLNLEETLPLVTQARHTVIRCQRRFGGLV